MSKRERSESEPSLVEGLIAVKAVLSSGKRSVYRLWLRDDRAERKLENLAEAARQREIPVERVPASQVDEMAGGRSHGGVVAAVGERIFEPPAALLPESGQPFIVMLDGIEDPFNFGQAMRALWAAGAGGFVVRPRNWTTATAVVARASAGVSELAPLAIFESAIAAAEFYRECGLLVAATTGRGGTMLADADLTQPLFLLVGGERRGVTRSFLAQADVQLRIPYGRAFPYSLGTTAAAAVLGYEVARQRAVQKRSGGR